MNFNDQPHIECPSQLAERGFADISFRHDMSGHAWNEQRKMSVWCAEENRDDREDEHMSRFEVALTDEDGYPMKWVYQTESLDDLLAFLDGEKA